MDDQEVGVLEIYDFAAESAGFYRFGGSSGITILKNGDDDNPWTLPDSIEVSLALLMDSNFFNFDDYGILTFDAGVLNGWAKYRLDSCNQNGTMIFILRDGEIVPPMRAIRAMEEAMQDE